MSWPSVPHFNQPEKTESLTSQTTSAVDAAGSMSSSLSSMTQTPNSKDAFLRFLKRVDLQEYADWFLLPGIAFSTEKHLREGITMMQRHPELLQQAAKSYPLPDDLDLRYLTSRLIDQHSYAVLIISPDGSPKRDSAIMQDAKRLQELFVRANVFGYPPEDVFLVVARTAKDVTTELRKLASLTELNEASSFVFYYSGHGVGQALLFQDKTRVTSTDLSKLLQDIRAKSKLAILDCCFAGSMVDPVVSVGSDPSDGVVRQRADSGSLQLNVSSRGMAVLGSSNRTQTSAWFDGLTSFLICALEGALVCPLTNSRACGAQDQCSFFRTKACQLEKGYICIFDLFQYLKKHANEFRIDDQKYVHPYLKYEGDDNFRVCAFAGRPVEQEELDNFITRTMADDGDVDMQKYFLKRLSELGTEMDCNLRNAISEGDARLQNTLLAAITSTTEQVKQSLLQAISDGDARVRDAAIEHVERAVEHVVESQILTHAPNLVSDAVATTIRTVTNLVRAKYAQDNTVRLLPYVADSAIPIDQIFTNLNVVTQDQVVLPPQILDSREAALSKYEEVYHVYQHSSIEAIFGAQNETVKRLLIQGRPGIGKSTLCRRLVREWGAGSLWPGRFHAMFLLPLGLVTEADSMLDLPHMIHKYCLDASPVVNVSLLGQAMRQRAEKMLIILDGYDEYSNPKHSPAVTRFIHGQLSDYHQCRVILTSRISSVAPLRQVLSERHSFDLELEVVGFTEAATQRFIYNYFNAVESPELAPSLISALKNNSVLQGIAHIPLHTTLLCMSWEERKGVFPSTSTELVKHLVDDILERNTRRLAAFRGEAKTMQTVLGRMLMCLGQLALHGFQSNALMFQASTVEEICKSKLPAELGFLHEDKVSSRRKGSKAIFYFLHLVFQEYFAAMFLVNTKTILTQFNADARYDMIWRFAAGFLGQHAGPLIELVLHHAVLKSSRRLILVALDCMHESRSAENHAHLFKSVLERGVDLNGSGMTPTHMAQLLQLTERFPTPSLSVCGTPIFSSPPVGLPSIPSLIARNNCITKLWLANNKMDDDLLRSLSEALMNNHSLTNLNLEGNMIGQNGIESLTVALSSNSTITNINLSRNPINDAGLRILAAFLKRSCIRVLGIAGRPLSKTPPAFGQVISQAIAANTNLLEIDLSWNCLGIEAARSLEIALSLNRTLRVLKLDHNRLGAVGIASIATALTKNATLTSLSLSNCDVGPVGAQHLSTALTINCSLTHLNLEANHIGCVGVKALIPGIQSNRALVSLSLASNDLGLHGATQLAAALTSASRISELDLYGNMIGDNGLHLILSSGKCIRSLNVGKNSITSEGLENCSQVLASSLLTDLRLDYNAIGVEGCSALAAFVTSSSRLTFLSLSNCDIGDVGLTSLQSALERSPSLTELDISTNAITTAGLIAVARILGTNNTLQSICLAWNNANCDDEEISSLFPASISCRVSGLESNRPRGFLHA